MAPGAVHSYRERLQGEKLTDEDLLSPNGPNCVSFSWPHIRPLRVVTQQGNFSANMNLTQPHDQYILQACSDAQQKDPNILYYKKIIIQPELKPIILQQLCAMNVVPHALFPGLDGLGKSLSNFAYLKTFGL